jgi:hypothetical protein
LPTVILTKVARLSLLPGRNLISVPMPRDGGTKLQYYDVLCYSFNKK